MKWYHAAVTASILIELVASTPSAMAGDARKVPMITMTANELREIGIAVRSAGASALPNSCASAGAKDISVSDEMLAGFGARGFSLVSLCLGLISSALRYDPDTGTPMPFAVIGDDQQFPLNLPDCFSKATPQLDCKYAYHHFYGDKIDEKDAFLPQGKEIDAIARRLRRTSGILYPNENCNKRSNPFNSMCVALDRVVFSRDLPRGYGYALEAPGGSDPEEDKVDLNTYRKRSGASLWSDGKSR